jgi:ADP-heptose:LPS heptosyltransferase
MSPPRPKILVARIGAFGDVCMLLPLVRSLAKGFDVHLLVRDAYVPVVRAFSEVACRTVAVSPADDPRQPFPESLVARLADEGYAALVDCSHWPCVAWLADRLRAIPVRAVTLDPAQDRLLGIPPLAPADRAAFNVVVPAPEGVHQVEKWRRLFAVALGERPGADWPLAARRPPPEPGRGPLRVFLHPHAGKPEKIWPAARFARLLAGLARVRRERILCEVNAVRRRTVRELRVRLAFSGVDVRSVPFDPSFERLRSAVAACDLAIGCDSGPMHFAALLGAPTVVLFGRYPAAEFGPRYRSVPVEPPGQGLDVDALRVEAVAAAVTRTLARLEDDPPDSVGRAA